ncbi:hypothetical protein [Pandoravirus japonicus]|uniref:Uncharacterized protein n=1 Tax=Pandoravirus japonicus TaxID=2823154 RepID=A0A811BMI2_9VIRU|nr:hypothetical protein [Pandoravirus japonicus]
MQTLLPKGPAAPAAHPTVDAKLQRASPRRRPGAQSMVGDPDDARSAQDLFEAWYLKSGAVTHGLDPDAETARRVWNKMLPPRAAAMTTKWCRSYWERQCAANLTARHGRTYVPADRVRKTDDGKRVSLADIIRQIAQTDRGEHGREVTARVTGALESAGWHFARERTESTRCERVIDLDLLPALVGGMALILANDPERASVAAYWGSTAHLTLLLGHTVGATAGQADSVPPVQSPYATGMHLVAARPVVSPAVAYASETAASYTAPDTPALQSDRVLLPEILPYDMSARASPCASAGETDSGAADESDGGNDQALCARDGLQSAAQPPWQHPPDRLRARSSARAAGISDAFTYSDDGSFVSANGLGAASVAGTTELDLNDPPPVLDGGGSDDIIRDIKIEIKDEDEDDEPRSTMKRKCIDRADAEDQGTETEDETEDEEQERASGQSGPPSPIEVDYPPITPADRLALSPKRRRTARSRVAKGRDSRTIGDDSNGRWHVWRNV